MQENGRFHAIFMRFSRFSCDLEPGDGGVAGAGEAARGPSGAHTARQVLQALLRGRSS